ncbi:hypothetical protein BC827DRAFT_1155167 [Russula dissimulans]|nr:hypothetical protein BC827DRAFT_1155167 [Russula dissimulans]
MFLFTIKKSRFMLAGVTPFSESPDTYRPKSSTARCTSPVSAMRLVSTSTCALVLSLCRVPKVARTAAGATAHRTLRLGAHPGGEVFPWRAAVFWHQLVEPCDRVTAKGESVGWNTVRQVGVSPSAYGRSMDDDGNEERRVKEIDIEISEQRR